MKTILVVDDHRSGAETTATMLRKLAPEFSVEIAIGGPACIARIDQQPPVDVMLLDIDMPGMSGAEVIRALIKHQPPLAVTIVPVTAWGAEWLSMWGMESDHESAAFKRLVGPTYDKGSSAHELVAMIRRLVSPLD